MLPIGGVEASTLLATFDASVASCAVADDYDTLISIVEASFGDLDAFNAVVRALVLT